MPTTSFDPSRARVLAFRGDHARDPLTLAGVLGAAGGAVGVALALGRHPWIGSAMFAFGLVTVLFALRARGNTYLLAGTAVGWRSGLRGRVTRSVDLHTVALATLTTYRHPAESGIVLWSPAVEGSTRFDWMVRCTAGHRWMVKPLEQRVGRLRPFHVQTGWFEPEALAALEHAMAVSGVAWPERVQPPAWL